VNPVPVFVTVTSAVGTTAPVASVTVPKNEPSVPICENIANGTKRAASKARVLDRIVKAFHGIVECCVTTVNGSEMDLFRMLNTTESAPLDVENKTSEAGS
jgi:hypothetical protein